MEYRPDWLTNAISASEDFHYGVEDEIEAIYADATLTTYQKQARIERIMINARHKKWKNSPMMPIKKADTRRRLR